jgi:hypothetical protein
MHAFFPFFFKFLTSLPIYISMSRRMKTNNWL